MGREGGQATLKKYGIQHFKELGRRGFAALVNKYFGGDREEAYRWLSAVKNEAALQKAAQAKLDAGETCVEIPCALHPDDDPFFEEPRPSWAERVKRKAAEMELPF